MVKKVFFDGNNTLLQQVAQNTADIAELEKQLPVTYSTAAGLPPIGQSAIIPASELAPAPSEGTYYGFVINSAGVLARVNSVTSAGVTLTTIADLRGERGAQGASGADGVGIVSAENYGAPTEGDGFTITHIKILLTTGEEEYIDVYAMTAPTVTITAPASATQGTFTTEQLNTLGQTKSAVIVFNNEIYYAADREHDVGILTYVHNGLTQDGAARAFKEKAISVTKSTGGWVLVEATPVTPPSFKQLFLDFLFPVGGNRPYIQFPDTPAPAEIWEGTTWGIDTRYQGRAIIGSGGNYTFGLTGGSSEHSHTLYNGFAKEILTYTSEKGNCIIEAYKDTPESWVANRATNDQRQAIGSNYLAYGDAQDVSPQSTAVALGGSTDISDNQSPYIVVNFWRRTS